MRPCARARGLGRPDDAEQTGGRVRCRAVPEHDVEQQDRSGRVGGLVADALVAQRRVDHRVRTALGELVVAHVDDRVLLAHPDVGQRRCCRRSGCSTRRRCRVPRAPAGLRSRRCRRRRCRARTAGSVPCARARSPSVRRISLDTAISPALGCSPRASATAMSAASASVGGAVDAVTVIDAGSAPRKITTTGVSLAPLRPAPSPPRPATAVWTPAR